MQCISSQRKVVEKGFTALELIIVLIVGFSIIALSASKMGELFSASSSNEATNSILALYSAGLALKSSTGYGTDMISDMISTGTLPKHLGKDASGKPVNEWGQPITITTHAQGVGFDLTYAGVPKANCIKLAQVLLASGNFSEVHVGSSEVTSSSTVAEIAQMCADETSTGNTLIFSVGGQMESGSP